MVSGRTFPTMVMCGFRMNPTDGRLIATGPGPGSLITAGRGLAMSPGAGRRITTDAGSGGTTPGRGGRGHRGDGIDHSGRRRMSRSGDGVAVGVSDSAGAVGAALAGCRSARVTGSIRGGAGIADALARLMPGTEGTAGVLADLLLCTGECASRTLQTFITTTSCAPCRRLAPAGSVPGA